MPVLRFHFDLHIFVLSKSKTYIRSMSKCCFYLKVNIVTHSLKIIFIILLSNLSSPNIAEITEMKNNGKFMEISLFYIYSRLGI